MPDLDPPPPLTIADVAAGGDGVARLPSGEAVFVPFALPDEVVRARVGAAGRAVLEEVLLPSPERVAPACPHFGACGGCALQHWADAPYAAWKLGLLRRALEKAGYADPPIAALRRTPPAARRRMEFAARRTASGLVFGLHAHRSQDIVPIGVCPVLHPDLARLLPRLPALIGALEGVRRQADVAVNLLDTGPDLLIRADAAATPRDRARLAAFAAAEGIGRIAWSAGKASPENRPENAVLLRPPAIAFAGVSVQPPPGAFLQASREGEQAIVESVLEGLPALRGKQAIMELYAGIGTLTFPLAARGRVVAYEGDRNAAEALRRAVAGTRATVQHRDLARQPLQAKELSGAAAVVLDPPHAGAATQMPAIAASGVPVVVMVSCNPAALARDAATLRAAGYALTRATPIDQFLWSAQLEGVCVFTK